ncbi:MAG: hypothetical protein ACYCYI_11695 [Saccharofermentanales bacterium]
MVNSLSTKNSISDINQSNERSPVFKEREMSLEPIGARSNGETSVNFNIKTGCYEFTYSDAKNKIKYLLDTNSDSIKTGMISVEATLNNHHAIYPVSNGGTKYNIENDNPKEPEELAKLSHVRMNHIKKDSKVIFSYEDEVDGIVSRKNYEIYLNGMTLIIEAYSDCVLYDHGYVGFTTGKTKNIKNARAFMMVFAEDNPVIVVDNSYFMSAYIDKSLTNATSKTILASEGFPDNDIQTGVITKYDKNSKGEVNPLQERMYITLSENILDCVYLTSALKSEYRDKLSDLVVLEEWGGLYSFNDMTKKYKNLFDRYMIDKILFIGHPWQRDGYDISLPAHFPAAEDRGGSADMKNFIDTIQNSMGWIASLHEDYWFLYPSDTNQYWNDDGKTRIARDSLLQFNNGYLNENTKVHSLAIKSGEMKHFAEIETKLINDHYKTKAVYLDVNTSCAPDFLKQVTLDAESENSRSIGMAVTENIELFQSMKRIHNGPLVGEGYINGYDVFNSIYAGNVDGVEREIKMLSGATADIMPDYELRYIRPLMANQGMGYQSRFSTEIDASLYDWDRYNTMSIVYGHTGLLNNMIHNMTDARYVHGYYMFQAIQSQYLDTSVDVLDIGYFNGSGYFDISTAIKTDYNFINSRIHISYSNGLEIFANFSDTIWNVFLNGKTYVLDKNGYAAENESIGFIQYSCLIGNTRADYADCEKYTYANARNNHVDFGSFITNGIKLIRKNTNDQKSPVLIDIDISNA